MDENKIRKGFYCYEDSQVQAPAQDHSHHTWPTSGCYPRPFEWTLPRTFLLGKDHLSPDSCQAWQRQLPESLGPTEGPCACPPLPPAPLKMLFTGLGLSTACLGSPGVAADGRAGMLERRSSPGSGCGPGAHLRASTCEQAGHGGAGSNTGQPATLPSSQERPKPRIPVLHFRAARPPFVICVKLVSISSLPECG